ncbi:MAG: F0F1 ATP synthase subunit B [Hydrogenophilus sp.]|nr:F0F1 ATP synthase subunit B [Hydrogenophilus sp.]
MNLNATLIAQLVVFFVLGWFTMRFVWPPLMRAIDERSAKIAEGLAAADKAKADLALAERRAIEELKKAREEAAQIRAAAEQQASKILEEARSEATQIIARAVKAAEDEARAAVKRVQEDLRAEVARLALLGAEQILRREVDANVHAELLARLKEELR